MNQEDRAQLFDEWATYHDRSVQGYQGFPFEGYEQVLDTICAGVFVIELLGSA
jgi:hypothetical protein